MACMKCGKKTKEDQVFCTECLEVMEKYPVKRDIHIQLPNRPTTLPQKRTNRRRRNLPPEEQVIFLRGRIRRQNAAIVLLVLALLASLVGLLYFTGEVDKLIKLGTEYTQGK